MPSTYYKPLSMYFENELIEDKIIISYKKLNAFNLSLVNYFMVTFESINFVAK